jgi:hypothetical protein
MIRHHAKRIFSSKILALSSRCSQLEATTSTSTQQAANTHTHTNQVRAASEEDSDGEENVAGNRDARSGAEQMNAAHFGNHLSWANERKK